MNKNKFIIIAAPSGSGKSSIVNMLLNDNTLKLNFSTSATTRPKRVNEVDGKNYYFFSKERHFFFSLRNLFRNCFQFLRPLPSRTKILRGCGRPPDQKKIQRGRGRVRRPNIISHIISKHALSHLRSDRIFIVL